MDHGDNESWLDGLLENDKNEVKGIRMEMCMVPMESSFGCEESRELNKTTVSIFAMTRRT